MSSRDELCPVCGQPDNCGDCDHTPLTSRDRAVLHMGFEPYQEMEVNLKPWSDGSTSAGYGHVALHFNGMTLWLNIMCLEDHDCIDVRTFRPDARYAQGVMAISQGRRVIGMDKNPALRGHDWPAAYSVTLMTDREPGEKQDTRPYGEMQE